MSLQLHNLHPHPAPARATGDHALRSRLLFTTPANFYAQSQLL
jgi:hypothetical protein